MTIATPPARIGVVGGRPSLLLSGCEGEFAYQFDIQREGNLTSVRLEKLDGTGTSYEVVVTPHRASCTCDSFRFGRKLPGTNERVYGSCKHTESVRVLLDVLAGIGG